MKIDNYIVIIIVFLLMSLFIYSSLSMINEGYSSYKKDYVKKFVLIKEEDNDYFWDRIENGIVDICDANDIAIEILDVSTTNLVSQKEVLEMAIISKPNGIIMNGYNSEQMQDVLEDAQINNIPIVFINDDGVNLLRKAYVGPNNYKIGQKAIQELTKDRNKDVNVLIVDDDNLQNRSLLIDGIISEIDRNTNI
ncbi:MAG: substrate-binding domain-containing protein, partial [Bacillota bacterium]|nr:substrate-binding domain-containing protein [Bacillota bacterium]